MSDCPLNGPFHTAQAHDLRLRRYYIIYINLIDDIDGLYRCIHARDELLVSDGILSLEEQR